MVNAGEQETGPLKRSKSSYRLLEGQQNNYWQHDRAA